MTDPNDATAQAVAVRPLPTPPYVQTAIDLQRESLRAVFQPRTMAEAIALSERVARSTICPERYRGAPDDIFVAAAHGAELGLTFLQSLQSITVINGSPSIYGDAALAVVRASTLCLWMREWVDESNPNNLVGHSVTHRRGEPEQVERTFSEDDAEHAGLLTKKGPWQTYRKRMLQVRARGFCLRDTYPDVLRGLTIYEELVGLRDGDDEPTAYQTVEPAVEVARVTQEIPMPRAVPTQVVIDAEVEAAADLAPVESTAALFDAVAAAARRQPVAPTPTPEPEPVTSQEERTRYAVVRVTQRSARSDGSAATTWTVFLLPGRGSEIAARTTERELAVRARGISVEQASAYATVEPDAEVGLRLTSIERIEE